jgi:hypothetical protein
MHSKTIKLKKTMAEDKRPFLLYTDLKFVINKLTNEKAGELFKTILAYVNDENPVIDDMLIDLVFEPIRQSLKRDLVKYNATKEKRAAAGRQGGIKSGETRSKTEQYEANEANGSSKAAMHGGSGDIEVRGVSEPTKEQPSTKPNKSKNKLIPLEAVADSPYGDGTLHHRVREWAKANPGKHKAEVFKDFLNYWTATVEKGQDRGRELWKTKLTFEIGQRLATWAKNEKQINQNGNKANTTPAEYLTKTARELEAIFSGSNSSHHAAV